MRNTYTAWPQPLHRLYNLAICWSAGYFTCTVVGVFDCLHGDSRRLPTLARQQRQRGNAETRL
jgi:hypothetical protein